MARTLTVPSRLIGFRAEQPVSPGMQAIVLWLGDAIDRRKFAEDVADAVWFEAPAAELRGGGEDNHWLREWLTRLTGVRLMGEHRGDWWVAVLLAEARIERGGSRVRLLVPPAGINALRDPENYAKGVDWECVLRVSGAARELYLWLADRQRQRAREADVGLAELRAILGVGDKRAYGRWDEFQRRVLRPAVARVNDLGPVQLTATPVKHGRAVARVRFAWRWKTLGEARAVAAENARHSRARGKPRDVAPEAPPLTDHRPPREEREAVSERSGALDYLLSRGGKAPQDGR